MSILTEFAMFPMDKGESVSAFVSRILQMIREEGASYQLTPMGTIFETETLREALGIIEKAHEVLAPDCNRIYATAKFDIRRGRSGRLTGKIASIEKRIGQVNH